MGGPAVDTTVLEVTGGYLLGVTKKRLVNSSVTPVTPVTPKREEVDIGDGVDIRGRSTKFARGRYIEFRGNGGNRGNHPGETRRKRKI